jgi:hypothetical protein
MVYINPNVYRTAEILDETNEINRQVRAMAKKQLANWDSEGSPEVAETLGERDKEILNNYIYGFLNAIDDEIKADYLGASARRSTTSELISRWNSLVIWFNSNVSRKFTGYLNGKIQTSDTLNKLDTIVDIAKENFYGDLADLELLNLYVKTGNYQRIAHIIFKRRENDPYFLTAEDKKKEVLSRRKAKIDTEKAQKALEELANPQAPQAKKPTKRQLAALASKQGQVPIEAFFNPPPTVGSGRPRTKRIGVNRSIKAERSKEILGAGMKRFV